MIAHLLRLAALLIASPVAVEPPATPAARAPFAYTLTVDPDHADAADVAIRVRGVGRSFHLAMAVHPEYDDRYWRFIEGLRVEGDDGRAGTVAREDSTLWRVTLPAGEGIVRYRVRIEPIAAGTFQGSWKPFLDRSGALVNGPDLLLYLPEHVARPATLELRIPAGWRVATGLKGTSATRFRAAGAAELLDAPLLLGRWHEWRFREHGRDFLVAYSPTDGSVPFDTLGLVDDLKALARTTLELFGGAPFERYAFLLRDGSGGALEHHNSVTVGVSSAELARDRRALMGDFAHEFFHTWNLVALHPVGYGKLGYRPPGRTAGLWWGEGITMYYADVLRRRAGIASAGESRLDHLARILGDFYDAPANQRVSPERASLAFGQSPAENPDAEANYYVQGELVGIALDGAVADSTKGRRGLDDIMRAMYRRRTRDGFSEAELEATADAVCGCRLRGFFARHVSGAGSPPVRDVLAALGFAAAIDTVEVTDVRRRPRPDLNVWVVQRDATGPARLVVPGSGPWARAGLRMNDTIVAANGTPVRARNDLRSVLRGLRIGDTLTVDVLRGGAGRRIRVPIVAARHTRVRFAPVPDASPAMRRRLARWLTAR